MRFLKTNTAVRLTVGPFLDKTDGVTPETALTVTSCKLTLMVDDGNVPTLVLDTAPTASGGANDMVHVTGDDAGFYDLELAAGNVNYLGRAMLAITDAATHCPVFHEFMILPANVYDSLVLGTDTLQADVTQWLGTAAATPTVAGVPEVDLTHISGSAVSTSTAQLGVNAVQAGGTAWGSGAITAASIANGAIDAATFAADVDAEILSYLVDDATRIDASALNTHSAITAAGIADAVWDEDATAHQTQGTFGQAIGDPGADTDTIWGLANTNLNATVGSRASQTSVDTIDDLLDTEISTLTTELAKVPKSDGTASWNATALAAIQSEANDALVAYDPPTKAELDSAVAPLALEATLATVDNLIDTEISTLITMLTGIVPVNGTIGATGNSTTALHLDGIAWADDGPNSMLLTIQDVSTGLYYSRWIEDFATTGDIATVATLPFTPEASVDKYWLTPVRADVTGGSGLDAAGVRAAIGLASANLDTQLDALPTAAENRAEMDSNSTQLAAIVADTNELQTDDYPTTLATLATAAELAKVPKSDGTSSWNATALAAIQSEANDALVAQNLDHLVKAAVDTDFATTVHLDSVIGHLADAGTTATFDRTTDSAEALQAAIDTIDNFLDTEIAAILEDTGTTLQAELDGIQADTEDIQARLPAALTAGGNIKADVLAVSGDTTAADRLEALMDGIIVAQVNDVSATTTSFVAAGFTEATNDHFNGRLITFISGALSGQQTSITDYVGATQTLTVSALTEAPANDDFFVIH